jgi:hypothetical protein
MYFNRLKLSMFAKKKKKKKECGNYTQSILKTTKTAKPLL